MALHRALDGDGPYPFALRLAQLSEAFPGRLPSELLREVGRLPVGLLEEVLEARAYLQAKQTYDAAERKQDLPKHWPMLDEVGKIDLEIAAEDLAMHEADATDG